MGSNVVKMFPQTSETVKIKAKPLGWVKNLINRYKEKQDELRQKKIDFLIDKSYDYYLTLILTEIIKSGEVDFHPSLYRAGVVINTKAQSLAVEAVVNNVVKFGSKRIDEAFSKCVKSIKRSAKIQNADKNGGNR